MLLAVTVEWLLEAAAINGFVTDEYGEHFFILYVFQPAFIGGEKGKEPFERIEQREEKKVFLEMNWPLFQQEYRNAINLAKKMKLMPGGCRGLWRFCQ